MNLYLVSQNTNRGYDTYDSMVVCAETEEQARYTYPEAAMKVEEWDGIDKIGAWCNADQVDVKLIGVAAEDIVPCVICASYNFFTPEATPKMKRTEIILRKPKR